MTVLWVMDHFRPYVSGKRYTLITDCLALSLLFKSRDLCSKLHR